MGPGTRNLIGTGNIEKFIFICNNFFKLKINFKTKNFYFFPHFFLSEHANKCSFFFYRNFNSDKSIQILEWLHRRQMINYLRIFHQL